LYWFDDFKEITAGESETNEMIVETEVPEYETKEKTTASK
jgi:hypothetical protein